MLQGHSGGTRPSRWVPRRRDRNLPLSFDTVKLIPTRGALFPRGGPVQDPVLTEGGGRTVRTATMSIVRGVMSEGVMSEGVMIEGVMSEG